MSQGTDLYEFLYDWANRIFNTEAQLTQPIYKSHQDVQAPSNTAVYTVIKYAPNRTKIGRFSAGDSGYLAAVHQNEPNFATTDVNITTDTITLTAHSFEDDDLVSFSTTDTLPAGLAVGTYYHIINKATNTVQVSAIQGGSAINLTDVGIGTHTIEIEGVRSLINDYDFLVEIWEVNGTGESLRLLIDSMDRQEIKDLWSAGNFALRSQGEIQNLPRLPQNKWKKEAMVELTIGAAEATLEKSGFISDLEFTGMVSVPGGAEHTITNI